MKHIRIFFGLMLLATVAFGCNAEDDICQSTESTPRMKVKFKTQSTGRLKTLDSVFVSADLGAGFTPVIAQKYKTDSIFLPLRIDGTPFTRYQIRLSQKADAAAFQLNYTTEKVYVSPACGYKLLYHDLTGAVDNGSFIKGTEVAAQNILDENKTNLFLLF